MKFFALAPLFAVLCNFPLAIFVYLRNRTSVINQVFLLWGLSLSAWNAGAFLMFNASDSNNALIYARFLHLGVIFIPVSVIHLSLLIARINVGRWICFPYILATCLGISLFSGSYFEGVRNIGYAYFITPGVGFWVYSSVFPLLTIPAVALVIRRRSQLDHWQRRKLTPLIIANSVLLIFGTNDILPALAIYKYPFTDITIYPWGTLMAFVYGILVAYSVLQDELLDVRISIGRNSAILLRLLFFSLISATLLLLASFIFSDQFTFYSFCICLIVIIFCAFISSIFFPKLLGTGSESLERRILGDRFEYQEKIRAFIQTLYFHTQKEKLLDDLEALLLRTVNISSYQIALFDTRSSLPVVLRTFPPSHPKFQLKLDSTLLNFFRRTQKTYIDYRIPPPQGDDRQRKEIHRQLVQLKVELSFTFYSHEEPFGVLLLGKKQGGMPFTSLDRELLSELVQNLSIVLDHIRLKDQLALTEQLESLALMSRGLAHDLNNLITPINTYLQLEAATFNHTDPKEELHRIATMNMQTIRAYVREAVFFGNTLNPNIAPITAKNLLNGVDVISRQLLEKRGIKLEWGVAQSFDFHGDEILLQRMLVNLVSNAIDASPDHSTIKLNAQLMPVIGNHPGWVRFIVSDQGMGISKENIARVFAPYFSTKDRGDQTRGFGLGLTICQKIAHLHQGTITLQSAEGIGTTVQVDLPIRPEKAALPSKP